MRTGALRNTLTVQRQVQVGTTSLNEPNFQWADWKADVFCEVEVKRGREHFDVTQRKRYSEEVWRFRVRWSEVEGLDTSMKIVHEGMDFDIKAVLPDGQYRRDCIIECTLHDGVLGSAALAIAITESIPSGSVGEVYGGFSVSASGGTAPYTFSVASGALPTGLSLNASTGAVSGTPTGAGSSAVVFRVTDADGATSDLPSVTITVAA